MSEKLAASAARICRAVCRELGWRPEDFWSATPQEIATIFTDEKAEGQPGMDRDTLAQMMERDAHG